MLINNTLYARYSYYSPPAAERTPTANKPEAVERVVEGEWLRERSGRDQEWFGRAVHRAAAVAAATPAARLAVNAYLNHSSDDAGSTPAQRVDYYV